MAQSEPQAKCPSALPGGVRFCARLLLFKGLSSFFQGLKLIFLHLCKWQSSCP
jgi:hypothetical protein